MTGRIDRINLQASRYRRVSPGRVAVSLVAFLPFLLGWVARKTVLVTWATVSWLWAAMVVGWQSADGQRADSSVGRRRE